MTATAANVIIKPPRRPKLKTYDDLVRLTPPNNGNYELHDGKIIFMPSPLATHQIVSSNLHIEIGIFLKKSRAGIVLAAPMDVRFTPHDIVQPDLLFISNERMDILQKIVEGGPDLVVEIKSDSNTSPEMSYKKFLYETGGVREYWIIDTDKMSIKQYLRIDDELILQHTYQTSETLQSPVLEGFTIELSSIF